MNTVLSISANNPAEPNNLQSDVRVFSSHGVHGKCVIAALPAISEDNSVLNHPVASGLIESQVDVAMGGLQLRIWKVGELSSIYSIGEVSTAIRKHEISSVIFNPVLLNAGTEFYQNEIIDSLVLDLLPLSRLVVLTKHNAAYLLENSDKSAGSRALAQELHDIGANGVFIIDTPDEGSFEYVDVFLDGGVITEIRSPIIAKNIKDGLDSTLSASIAAHLAKGVRLEQAVQQGREYLTAVIASSGADEKHAEKFGLDHMLGKVAIEKPETALRSLSDTSGEIATLSKYMDMIEDSDRE
ncbi:MAG: bifunctional hydroxymethylpyrimidine kinase/phosphomethylpyrimidine kinase [Anaerolineae bacterium]